MIKLKTETYIQQETEEPGFLCLGLKELALYPAFSDQIPLLGYCVNSADPVQMPQIAASDQG